MTTVEILEGALDKLRRDGWTQNRPWNCKEMCLVAALAYTAGLVLERTTHFGWSFYQWNTTDLTPLAPIGKLLSQLGVTQGGVGWNNAPERTFADIEAVLTVAIAIAKEQDQPAPAVEVGA